MGKGRRGAGLRPVLPAQSDWWAGCRGSAGVPRAPWTPLVTGMLWLSVPVPTACASQCLALL